MEAPTNNQSDPDRTTYSYTGTGRLATWTKYTGGSASTTATYTYDSSGQRTRSVVAASGGLSTTTDFVYEGLLLQSLSASQQGEGASSWRITYLYDERGRPYAGLYRSPASSTSPVLFALLTTDRGDVVGLLDAAGNPFAAYRYDAWGNPQGSGDVATGLWSQATNLISSQLATDIARPQPLRYASYCYDTESGLYYLSARSYDPQTRQFLSKDLSRSDGEQSAYQYCLGNPVRYTDPTGYAPTTKDWVYGWSGHDTRGQWAKALRHYGQAGKGTSAKAAHGPPFSSLDLTSTSGLLADPEGARQFFAAIDQWFYDNSVLVRLATRASDALADRIAASNSIWARTLYGAGYLAVSPFSKDSIQLTMGLSVVFAPLGGAGTVPGVRGAVAAGSRTQILQSYLDDAARQFDALGMNGLTRNQAVAVARNPRLYPMFRGYQIHRMANDAVGRDPRVDSLVGRMNRGPDFIDAVTGQIWDMTTAGQAARHMQQYPGVIILPIPGP